MERQSQREARLQAHYAAQWLGRAGGAFVPPAPDYSHTSMNWESGIVGFATNEFDGLRLGLAVPDLALVLLRGTGQQLASYALNGRTNQDVRRWLGAELGARGIDAGRIDRVTPYEIPRHAIASGGAYRREGIDGELRRLAEWSGAAHAALQDVRQLNARLAPSPVRCWPHHFDLATLISLDEARGEEGRSVNAGWSPGDEHFDEPYYYVSPYPYPEAAKLPPLSSGRWHTQDFTAAILSVGDIEKSGSGEKISRSFLNEAIERSRAALS